MKNLDWEIVFTGDLFAIERHIDKWYERAVRPPWVRLILKNPEWKICITREYREEQWWFDYRLPWGKVFDDLSSYIAVRDTPTLLKKAVYDACRIEAKQEVGVDIMTNLQIVHTSYAGASVEWTLFYASAVINTLSEQDLWGDELLHGIEVGFYAHKEVVNMIQNWEMREERSIAVLWKYVLEDLDIIRTV